ncbi:hypothetical protein [Escherichia phage EK010]|uniref:Uncharacterized protein n=1 Tax=Escherichia phage EK010 TaxID=2742112 RepID=A0A6J4EF90_9CAUD|nr:hypothetical protein PQC42_gp106 [Escherichia phage EK010]UYE89991.1 hypothetical protein [Escherichia phage E20-1]BCG44957.1 hypothetical protein [Escherichia phage EK010]
MDNKLKAKFLLAAIFICLATVGFARVTSFVSCELSKNNRGSYDWLTNQCDKQEKL